MSTEPWRYGCPRCDSVSLSPRTERGGYRCGECGWTGPAWERVDRKAQAKPRGRQLLADGGDRGEPGAVYVCQACGEATLRSDHCPTCGCDDLEWFDGP